MPTRRVGIIRAGNEPKASGRAMTKRKINRDVQWAPKGCPYDWPTGSVIIMGWVPYPAHMGPHFVGPIIRSLRSLQNKKVNMWPRSCWGNPKLEKIKPKYYREVEPSVILAKNNGQKVWICGCACGENVKPTLPLPNDVRRENGPLFEIVFSIVRPIETHLFLNFSFEIA